MQQEKNICTAVWCPCNEQTKSAQPQQRPARERFPRCTPWEKLLQQQQKNKKKKRRIKVKRQKETVVPDVTSLSNTGMLGPRKQGRYHFKQDFSSSSHRDQDA